MASTNPVPDCNHTLTTALVVRGAREALEFYKDAFGAQELSVMDGPSGKLMHAELRFGDTKIFLGEESPAMGNVSPLTLGGTPVTLNLYVEDCDATFSRVVAAGATAIMPPADMFWGDRYAKLTDPFGHVWGIATHKEDVSPEEMERRGKEAMAAMGAKK